MPRTSVAAGATSISSRPETALAVIRPKQVQFTAKNGASNFYRVAALRPCKGVVVVETGLRHQIGSEISGVLDLLRVCANQCNAARHDVIAVCDAELCAPGGTAQAGSISLFRPSLTAAKFVDHRRADCRRQ